MSLIFRSHLPYSQAHILAGALASGGIPAAVAGDLAAHLYGGTSLLDCVVMVPEDWEEEAEAFLRADLVEEPPDPNLPAETCPPDGDPPGMGAILYATLCLAPFAAALPALLAGIQVFGEHATSLQPALVAMAHMYVEGLVVLLVCLPLHALGAGLLLRIIRGYKRGSRLSRLLVKGLLVLLIL